MGKGGQKWYYGVSIGLGKQHEKKEGLKYKTLAKRRRGHEGTRKAYELKIS